MKAKFLTGLILFSASSFANDRFASVEITTDTLRNNVHVLTGAGGNIGALTGSEGILIIDDQFEPLAPKIESALEAIDANDNDTVSYVVNTHYHGDHTGSNVYFSKSARIMAHEKVRQRLSVKSKKGLPTITYKDGIKLYLNDETVHVKHLAKGHTDGDSVVFFEKANVWHLGDLFFQGRFPYVDIKGGGSVDGYLANLKTLTEMIAADAIVIPGHGKVADKTELTKIIDMIVKTRTIVAELKSQGLSEADVVAKGLGERWKDWHWHFITEERWIKTLYPGV